LPDNHKQKGKATTPGGIYQEISLQIEIGKLLTLRGVVALILS